MNIYDGKYKNKIVDKKIIPKTTYETYDGKTQYRIITNGEIYSTEERKQYWLFGFYWSKWKRTSYALFCEVGESNWYDEFDNIEDAINSINRKIDSSKPIPKYKPIDIEQLSV